MPCEPYACELVAVSFPARFAEDLEWIEVRVGRPSCGPNGRRRGLYAERAIPRGGAVFDTVAITAPTTRAVHSSRPNAARASNRIGLFALRAINEGEEITEDYCLLPLFAGPAAPLWARLFAATPDKYWALLRRHGFLPLSEAVMRWCDEDLPFMRGGSAPSLPVPNEDHQSFLAAAAVTQFENERVRRERRAARRRAIVESTVLVVGGVLLLALAQYGDSLRAFFFKP